jgi:hypothetical protein
MYGSLIAIKIDMDVFKNAYLDFKIGEVGLTAIREPPREGTLVRSRGVKINELQSSNPDACQLQRNCATYRADAHYTGTETVEFVLRH